jgi:hypothetical protein
MIYFMCSGRRSVFHGSSVAGSENAGSRDSARKVTVFHLPKTVRTVVLAASLSRW